jgi:hypothetical protein
MFRYAQAISVVFSTMNTNETNLHARPFPDPDANVATGAIAR